MTLTQSIRIVALALLALSIAACGIFEREKIYVASREAEPLEVPDDLDPPRRDIALVMNDDSVPEFAAPISEQPPRFIASLSENSDSVLRIDAEGAYILLEDTPESVYRRLGLTIERAGMGIRERNPEQRFYEFNYRSSGRPKKSFFGRLLFWRDAEDPVSGIYRAQIRPEGEESRIYLLQPNGEAASDLAAEQILSVFLDRLG